ncbi:type II toxin-antitoxin system VapC family toxin [Candidatus Mycobacterium methanotrophicum]|uniref:Ribonuclease VapC n=1 Tax=Candidatus Mycobacterium methanotrophicum TaxID=2943498 RepID=A0ABY4QKM2_9MYCO|nr:type II toxin-antitoxin system VapC family toxin [Candidatus Mycobacterium methanotrophicum]UQX10359.1 type II toxin-antitoxin system VapC family toxin [Candidatus Mycobacterium methanotrophicum]
MILVDTSVWIDHLHKTDPQLVALLGADEVGSHAHVIEELGLGSIRRRAVVLELLGNLHQFPVLSHAEVMALVDSRRLFGRGLSAVDAHLLGSVSVTGGARLWTRDKRLISACRHIGASYVDDDGAR